MVARPSFSKRQDWGIIRTAFWRIVAVEEILLFAKPTHRYFPSMGMEDMEQFVSGADRGHVFVVTSENKCYAVCVWWTVDIL